MTSAPDPPDDDDGGWPLGCGRARPVDCTIATPLRTTQTTGLERKLPLPGRE